MDLIINDITELLLYLRIRKNELEKELSDYRRKFRVMGVEQVNAKLSEINSIISLIKKD